jgi:hypothetical protein
MKDGHIIAGSGFQIPGVLQAPGHLAIYSFPNLPPPNLADMDRSWEFALLTDLPGDGDVGASWKHFLGECF